MHQQASAFPKLTRSLNLLVAGHRKNRLGTHPDVPLGRLKEALTAFAALQSDTALADGVFGAELYARGPCEVRVIVGDADGVDAYAAGVSSALGLSTRMLTASHSPDANSDANGSGPSPHYATFGCPPEVAGADDDSAYALRDRLALAHADVLLAVWDGQNPQGRAGGVVRLIQAALRCGVPVLWIDPVGQLREADRSALDSATLFRLSNRAFNAQLAHNDKSVFSAVTGTVLTPAIRQWLNPLAAGAGVSDRFRYCRGHKNSAQSQVLEEYSRERVGRHAWERTAGLLDRGFSAVFEGNPAKLGKLFRQDPTVAYFGVPAAFPLSTALRDRFDWSDSRANVAAGRHRSIVWVLYVLSSLAVLAAISGALHMGVEHEGWQAIFWPTLEGIFLATILFVFSDAIRKKWHMRWLGHRFLAEQFRYLALTRPFLAIGDLCYRPLFAYDPKTDRVSLINAEAWLIRRALVTDGLSPCENGYDYHLADQKKWRTACWKWSKARRSGTKARQRRCTSVTTACIYFPVAW